MNETTQTTETTEPLPPKRRKKAHPLLRDREVGVWHEDIAALGQVPGYPKTQERFDQKQALCRERVEKLNAEGKTCRRGRPNGYAGKKVEVEAERLRCREAANRVVRVLAEVGWTEQAPVTGSAKLDEGVDLCLAAGIELVLNRMVPARVRLCAMNAVLPYLRVKPMRSVKGRCSRQKRSSPALPASLR